MKKIRAYHLVVEQEKYWFNKAVNDLIRSGYQPFEQPQITTTINDGKCEIVAYSQVMVIYQEDIEKM